MKHLASRIHLLAILIAGYCLAVIAEERLSSNSQELNKEDHQHRLGIDGNIVDVTIVEAILPLSGSYFAKVYCLDSKDKLTLPITQAALKNITSDSDQTGIIKYTQTPNWNYSAGFSDSQFTLDSYLAFEVWRVVFSQDVYIGGLELTVRELELNPQNADFGIVDESGQSVGQLNLVWRYG